MPDSTEQPQVPPVVLVKKIQGPDGNIHMAMQSSVGREETIRMLTEALEFCTRPGPQEPAKPLPKIVMPNGPMPPFKRI